MDFGEWELLPEGAGFLDFPEDEEKKSKPKPGSNTKTVFNMNYFICPSSPNSSVPNPNQQLMAVSIPFPIQLETVIGNYKNAPDQDDEEVVKEKPSALEAEVSRVFFNKMKENEFVDMKMDSPKSPNTRAILIDDCNNNNNSRVEDHIESCMISPRMRMINEKKMNNMKEDKEEEIIINKSGGLKLFTGIGAICSFGIAAATICILYFGNNHHHQHNQKLRFQIYTTHDKIFLRDVIGKMEMGSTYMETTRFPTKVELLSDDQPPNSDSYIQCIDTLQYLSNMVTCILQVNLWFVRRFWIFITQI